MSALLKAAQDQADAETAQKYVECSMIKKFIAEKLFRVNKGLYPRTSKLLDVEAWIRQAPTNPSFLGTMYAQLDSFVEELIKRESDAADCIMQDVARHFEFESLEFHTDHMKKRAVSMSDQQCREALPFVIDLLGCQIKRVLVEMEERKIILRVESASKRVDEIYLETARKLAHKVDQLENSVRDLSSSIRTMEKQASKTAAKLAMFAETVETYVGGVHTRETIDPFKRLASSIDKLSGLAPSNDSNIVKKDVYESLLDAHDQLLHEVNCLKIGRERYRAHIDDLKAKLNAAKQPSALGKKGKKH